MSIILSHVKLKERFVLFLFLFSIGFLLANDPIVNFSPSLKFRLFDGGARDADNNKIDIDVNKDGEIQQSEADRVIILVHSANVNSLDGIENLRNLENYATLSNQIRNLDLSKNKKLKEIWLSTSYLLSLDVSGCTELEFINIALQFSASYRQPLELDFSKNTKLKTIQIRTWATSIDDPTIGRVNKLNLPPSIEELECGGNQLEELDLSMCKELKVVSLSINKLKSIDLSSCTKLTGLNVSQNPFLTYVGIKNTSIETGVYLEENFALQEVCADTAQLTSIRNYLTSNNILGVDVHDRCVLSTENVSINKSRKEIVFTNPVEDSITFLQEVEKVELYHLSGQLIKILEVNQNKADVSFLKSGNYIIKLYTNQGVVTDTLIKL